VSSKQFKVKFNNNDWINQDVSSTQDGGGWGQVASARLMPRHESMR